MTDAEHRLLRIIKKCVGKMAARKWHDTPGFVGIFTEFRQDQRFKDWGEGQIRTVKAGLVLQQYLIGDSQEGIYTPATHEEGKEVVAQYRARAIDALRKARAQKRANQLLYGRQPELPGTPRPTTGEGSEAVAA